MMERRSSRLLSQNETKTPNYNTKHHPMDEAMRREINRQRRDRADAVRERVDDSSSKNANTPAIEKEINEPKCRRSNRTSFGEKLYDMKHHPMDDTLRPGVVAKRSEYRLRKVALPLQGRDSKAISPAKSQLKVENPAWQLLKKPISDSSPGAMLPPPARSPSQNLSSNERPLDWDELDDMDRRIYTLQKGAPVDGDTLPMKWGEVKDILFDEGYSVTLDDVNCWEFTERLKERYESVRIGVESFFRAKPEANNKKDWILLRAEGLDVFHLKPGSKYWRHLKDCIILNCHENDGRENASSSTSSALQNGDVSTETLSSKASFISHDMNGTPSTGIATADDAHSSEAEAVTPENAQDYEPSSFNTLLDETLDGRRDPPSPSRLLDRVSEPADVSTDRHSTGEGNRIAKSKHFSANRAFTKSNPSKSPTEKAKKDLLLPNVQTSRNVPANPPLIQDRNLPSQPLPTLNPLTTGRPSKKRKRHPITHPVISIHEDLPGRTPRIQRLVSMNPASPGTDIPKENLSSSQGEIEGSSQGEIPRTLRSRQRDQSNSTTRQGSTSLRPVVTPAAVENHPARALSYRSLFGNGFLR